MTYEYIEIGTSDYDTLNDYTKNKKINGISIEANPYYYLNLKKKEKNLYFNVFITNKKKEYTKLYYLHPNDLKKMGDIPIWFRGLSTFNYNLIKKNVIKEKGEKYIKYIKNIYVPNESIESLFKKNNIKLKKIKYVKIDTELADIIIVNMIIKYFQGNCNFLLFESLNYRQKNLKKLKKKYEKDYFFCTSTTSDWLLIKKNLVNKFIQYLLDKEKLKYKVLIKTLMKKLLKKKTSRLHQLINTEHNKLLFKDSKKLLKIFLEKKSNLYISFHNTKLKNRYKIDKNRYIYCEDEIKKYIILIILFYALDYEERYNIIIDYIIHNN